MLRASKEEEGVTKSDTADYDLSIKPFSFMIGWGVPVLAILVVNFTSIPLWFATIILSTSFAWMGVACVVNAQRCHRRHCYLSGPILLFAAIATGLIGFQVLPLGKDGLVYVVWGTLAVLALTFIPEIVWGKYVSGKN